MAASLERSLSGRSAAATLPKGQTVGNTSPSQRKRQKIAALLAAGLIVGAGGVATLASWTDTEWVFGGNAAGDGPGVGTSTFVVEQNTSKPYSAAAGFTSEDSNPGGALVFGPGALELAPGDEVYAPVGLRTTSDSISGTVQLKAAVAASGITATDAGDELWDALDLEIGWLATTGATEPAVCDAANFASYNSIALSGSGLGATPAAGTQVLSAAAGNVVHYCFKISLPDPSSNDLQGRTVAPAWEFESTSD